MIQHDSLVLFALKKIGFVASWHNLSFQFTDKQALNQTANRVHARNGRGEEVQRDTLRRIRNKHSVPYTHTQTHTRARAAVAFYPAESIVGASDSRY